jgi:hypothetical protein
MNRTIHELVASFATVEGVEALVLAGFTTSGLADEGSDAISKTSRLASLQKLPKNLPPSLRFRAVKTVRDQNWWAA